MATPDLFQLEKDVLKRLNEFNQTYAQYSRCLNGAIRINDPNNCENLSQMNQNVKDSYSRLSTALHDLQNAINNSRNLSGSKYNDIVDGYSKVKSLRSKLDDQLAELYQVGDTKFNFYEKQLMSSSYNKILLIILATSLTVYLFTK